MILETLFSGVGKSVVDKLFDLARQKNDEKLRAMIQEELAKMALGPQSNSIIIVNIHIGDLVQQVHELAKQGLSAQAVIEASRSHTLPELLSTSALQKTASALKRHDMLLFYDTLAGEGEFNATKGSGEINFLKRHSWRKIWTHIVSGNFGGSNSTGLFLYSASTGEAKFLSTDDQGNYKELHVYQLQKIWTHIVSGNFGGSSTTDLLLYSASTGEAKFLSTDDQGNYKVVHHDVGRRKNWSKIVPMASS